MAILPTEGSIQPPFLLSRSYTYIYIRTVKEISRSFGLKAMYNVGEGQVWKGVL